MSKPKLVILMGAVFMAAGLVSCVVAPTLTPTTTSTPAPTATIAPTPTPMFGIDMEKFTNFPQSYEYLLAHLDEFVQAPDPVNDRADFDRWFNEELVPAMGSVSERERNVDAWAGNARYSLDFTNGSEGHEITGQLHSFYFVSNNVVYFTPCLHTVKDGQKPGQGIMTVCIALFDHPQLRSFGNSGIEALAQGRIYQGYVYFNPKLDRPDLDYGDMEPIIESIGEYVDFENYVWFGFGFIVP